MFRFCEMSTLKGDGFLQKKSGSHPGCRFLKPNINVYEQEQIYKNKIKTTNLVVFIFLIYLSFMKLSFILFYEVALLLSLIGAEILFCLFKHSRLVFVEAQKRLQRIAGQELPKNY